MWRSQQACEPSLGFLDRLSANIVAVYLKQIECARDGVAADISPFLSPSSNGFHRSKASHFWRYRQGKWRSSMKRYDTRDIILLTWV